MLEEGELSFVTPMIFGVIPLARPSLGIVGDVLQLEAKINSQPIDVVELTLLEIEGDLPSAELL